MLVFETIVSIFGVMQKFFVMPLKEQSTMSTIGSNFTFGTAGTEDTLYGFSYANIKIAAFESADTDAFLLTSSIAGNL